VSDESVCLQAKTKGSRPGESGLSNTLDELQAREGKLSRSKIRSLVVEADVDDEPVWSVIPKRLVRQLGWQHTKLGLAV